MAAPFHRAAWLQRFGERNGKSFDGPLKDPRAQPIDFRMKLSFLKKRPHPVTRDERLQRIRKDPRFLGIQIYNGGCRASAAMAGYVFSTRNVPKLPLRDCTARQCTCEYLGVTDRRIGLDRRIRPDRRRTMRMQLDRRIGRDRRIGKDIWRGHDR